MNNEELWSIFHKLWGKAKDSKEYKKSDWTNLENAILRSMGKANESLVDEIRAIRQDNIFLQNENQKLKGKSS